MAAQIFAKRLTPEVKARISSAQGLTLDWGRCCSPSLIHTIEGHADAVGAPKEYIFFPLLTVVASFMGVNARICVNPEWSEPAILWTVVAARKGEKKTAVLKRLLSIVEVSKLAFIILDSEISWICIYNNVESGMGFSTTAVCLDKPIWIIMTGPRDHD